MNSNSTDNEHLRIFINLLRNLEDKSFFVNFILSVFSIFINIFHVIILTRKSMRATSINVFMIGIAICDLCTTLTTVYRYFSLVDFEYPECITSDSLVKAYADAMSWSVQYHFKRCSSWLGILMAGVRILIMRKISNAKFSKIMKPIFGISLMAIVFGISGILTTVWQYECQVIENRTYPLSPNCAEHQDIHGVFRFSLILRPVSTVADVVILRSYFISDSIISSLIPGISFPLLAVVLIREIRKLEKSRTRAIRTLSTAENEEKYGLSTKLIGLMTVAAFLSETPLGLISIFKQFFTKGDINIRLLTDLVIYFTILATFVSILHPVLCLLMSSKYCETLRKMFGISKTLPNSVTSIHII